MRNRLKLIVFFLVFLFIFFYKQIFFGEVFFCCDNLLINIPSKVFLVEQLKNGVFPLWNPYIFSGTPFLADINVSALFPLNFIYFLFEPFTALTWSIIILFGVGLVGGYVLGKSLKLGSPASIIVAIVFGFSGAMVTYTNNLPMLQVAALAPWVLVGWIKLSQRVSKGSILFLSFSLALQILAGHPQLVYYTLLLGILYFLFFSADSKTKKFLFAIGVVGFAALITSVQLLPFLEFISLSTRTGRGIEFATLGSVRPESLVRLLVPSIVGEWSRGTAWVQAGTIYGYVGCIPWVLLFFVSWKKKIVRFYGITMIISLLLACGSYTPIFHIFYSLVPGFGLFREPVHMLFVMTIAIAVLAGFGMQGLLDRSTNRTFKNILIIIGLSALLFAIIVNIFEDQLINGVFQDISLFPEKLESKLMSLSASGLGIIFHLVANNTVMIGISLLGVWFAANSTMQNIYKVIVVVVLLCVDLFFVSRGNILTVSYRDVRSWYQGGQQFFDNLEGFDKNLDRIFVAKDVYPAPVTKIFGDFNQDQESAWQFSILRPSINMLYNVSSVDGYASMVYKPYQDYFKKTSIDPTGINTEGIDKKTLGALGVRFFKTKESIFIYAKNDVSQRISIVDRVTKKSEPVHIQSITANGVEVSVQTNNAQEFIFREVSYPGWKAYLGKRQVPIRPYDKIFQSITIPQGEKTTVRFIFDPRSVKVGGFGSLFGVGVWIILFKRWLKENKLSQVRLKRKAAK